MSSSLSLKVLQHDPPALLITSEDRNYLIGEATNAPEVAETYSLLSKSTAENSDFSLTPVTGGYLIKSFIGSIIYAPEATENIPPEAATATVSLLPEGHRTTSFIQDNKLSNVIELEKSIPDMPMMEMKRTSYSPEDAGYSPARDRDRDCASCKYFNVDTRASCSIVTGTIDPSYTCWYFEPRTLQPIYTNEELSKSTPIYKLFPPHEIYIEPYLTSTVFLSKAPADYEILADPDPVQVELYKRIANLSDVEIHHLQQLDWGTDQPVRRRAPTSQLRVIHQLLLKSAPLYNVRNNTYLMKNRLPEIRDRLSEAKIVNQSFSQLSKDLDGPNTFYYLEPPTSALKEVLATVKELKGRFLIKSKTAFPDALELAGSYYLANYSPSKTVSSPTIIEKSEDLPLVYEPIDEHSILIAKSSDERRLVWTVNMVPYKVDHEGHWADEDAVLEAAHNFMLQDVPIWTEHKQLIKSARPVQSYTLLSDLTINRPGRESRTIKKGSWVTVLWISDPAEWGKVKSGEYIGTSIRSLAKARASSPPPAERTETPLYKLFHSVETA